MAAPNVAQIYGMTGDVQWTSSAMTLGNTNMAGTIGATSPLFTASGGAGGAGSMLQYLQFRPLGTNIANVARVFINKGNTPATEANNVLFAEVTLPACTAATTGAMDGVCLTVNLVMKGGTNVFLSLAGDASGPGWKATGVGMKY